MILLLWDAMDVSLSAFRATEVEYNRVSFVPELDDVPVYVALFAFWASETVYSVEPETYDVDDNSTILH